MSIFAKVTLRTLRMNKTRTAVTIIGIILSASMICAVTTLAKSGAAYAVESAEYLYGAWHGRQLYADRDSAKEIISSEQVQDYSCLEYLGYSLAEGGKNLYKPYIYLLGASGNAQQLLGVHIISGRFPENSGEILLPEHVLENAGLKISVSDTIELNLGDRSLDGSTLYQDSPRYYTNGNGDAVLNDERLVNTRAEKYTVVGFYERLSLNIEPYDSPGYTAITVSDSVIPDGAMLDVYFTLKNPRGIYDFIEQHGISYEDMKAINTSLLTMMGITSYDEILKTIYSVCAVITVLIMLASISLIYNAFSISVSERTKQFGLLSSVGATARQLKSMVYFEALTVSAVGIPLGIIAGVAGISVTLMLIGDKFQSLGFPGDMKVRVSFLSLAAAAVIALVTVLISARIPMGRAARVSAVEAIRQNTEIKQSSRRVKTPKLT